MDNILHTIYNTSTVDTAVINGFTFDNAQAIQHHADLTALGLSSDFTSNTTIVPVTKTYVSGGLYRKNYSTATFAVNLTITGYDGTTLMVNNTSGLTGKESWQGNGVYSGRYIVSITSATWLVMSNTPSGSPTIGGSIQFSTSTNELTLSGTTPTLGIGAGWTVLGNGYNSAGTVISVKNSYTLVVDNLPTNPTVGNPMTFRSPTSSNTVTVTSSAGLSVGFVASGNGFTNNQYITNISGNLLTMSAEPNGTPEYSTSMNFSDVNTTLYTIPTNSSVSFNLGYTTTTYAATNLTYASTLTITYTLGSQPQKSLMVYNFVPTGTAPPAPPPPATYTGGGGGRGRDRYLYYGGIVVDGSGNAIVDGSGRPISYGGLTVGSVNYGTSGDGRVSGNPDATSPGSDGSGP